MTNNWGFIIAAVILFFVFDVILLLYIFRRGKGKTKTESQMELLAGKFGLELLGGEPILPQIAFLRFLKKPFRTVGKYRDRYLKIYHYTQGSGKNSTTYATARLIGANPKNLSFQFYREGIFSRIGKAMGMKDVLVGDPRFDKLFIVKASDPDFITAALLPEIKEKFYRVWEECGARGTLKLEGEEMHYDEVGAIRNEATRKRFEAVADLLGDLGGAVDVYNQ